MQRQMVALIGITSLTLAAAGMPAAAAAHKSPPADPGFVIVEPSEAVSTAAGTFYPTGPLGDDTVIVIANEDGSLPGGLSEAALAQLLAEGPAALDAVQDLGFDAPSDMVAAATSHSYTAAYNTWTSALIGASIWGYDNTTRVSYSFSVTQGTNQQAAGQGLGYYRGYYGSQMGVWAKWYGLGLASDGGGSVPWGAVIASAKFKAMSTVLHLAIGYWTP